MVEFETEIWGKVKLKRGSKVKAFEKWLSKKVNIFGLYKHEYYNEKEDFQFKVGLGIKL